MARSYWLAVSEERCGDSSFLTASLKSLWCENAKEKSRSGRKAVFLCSDEPHYPGKTFRYFDDALVEFIARWTKISVTQTPSQNQNSAFVIWSDHGLHFTKESETPGGSAAHKQPMAWILLPKTKRFSHAHRSLVQNSGSLTSQYDLHLTFRHLLTGSTEVPPHSTDAAFKGSSQSLLEPLTNSRRKCHDIGIPLMYCPCSEDISCNDTVGIAKERADVLSKEISTRVLQSYEEFCHPLNLSSSWIEKACQVKSSDTGQVGVSMFSYREGNHVLDLEVGFVKESKDQLRVLQITSKHQWSKSWQTCKESNNVFNESVTRLVKELCVCKT